LDLFDNFSELYDEDLADKLLMMYFTRTKNKHALAFLQFRATLPKAKLTEIKEMFDDRAEYYKLINAKKMEMFELLKAGQPIPIPPRNF